MTQTEMPTHFGPEELGLRQPNPDELEKIEEGTTKRSLSTAIGSRALYRLGEWGPAHHRDDYIHPETPVPEGLSYNG